MKNIIASLLVFVFLVMASTSYAVTREPQYPNIDPSVTNFEKVGVSGNTNTGNPGYLALVSADYAGVNFTYYLWVDTDGKLRIVSYPTVSAARFASSFPTGDWRLPPFNAGTVVGQQ